MGTADNTRKLATSLGSALRVARLRQELTQADVAESIGISPEVFGRLERGQILPSVPTLAKICYALDVRADVLLGLGHASSPSVSEAPVPYRTEAHELRRLERRLRKLSKRHIKLISLLADALAQEPRPR